MFDPYLTGILLAYGVFMIGMFTPGPNILAVIGTSMSVGRLEGKALALGVATGTLCWSMLTLVGTFVGCIIIILGILSEISLQFRDLNIPC